VSDPVRDLKRELLAAAERQHGYAAAYNGRRRLLPRVSAKRLLLAATTFVIAAAASLFATTPWSSSPSFLARAEAELTPPPGTVLHQKWAVTTTSKEFGCTVRHPPSEIWVDQTAPHRYRAVLNGPPPAEALNGPRRALACWNGKAAELGGTLDTGATLTFVPPDELRAPPWRFGFPIDPVAELRDAITAGTAHDEGKTQLNGRTVERVRIDPESPCGSPGCAREPFYWFVDPKTFHPVGMEGGGGITRGEKTFLPLHVVVRFLAYEYLPRTAANLAMTDIRAQHPSAKLP
jgi:hypothetical protein